MIKVLCCWTVTIVMGLLFCGCGPDYQKILVESAAEDLQGEPARYGSITCTLGPVEFVDFTEKRVCDNPRLVRKAGFDTLVVGVFRRTPAPDGPKYYEARGQTVYFNPTHDLVFQLGCSGFGPLYEHFADKLSYKQVFQWLGDFSKMKAKKYYEIDPATSYRFELKKEMQVLDGEVAMVFMLEKGWYFNSVWDIEHLNEKDDCETFLICDCDGHLSNESENM